MDFFVGFLLNEMHKERQTKIIETERQNGRNKQRNTDRNTLTYV